MANLQSKWLISTLLAVVLAACGGGGEEQNALPTVVENNNLQCALGQLKTNGVCHSAANVCSIEAEKTWVRGHLDNIYLWYDEIKDVSPQNYLTASHYFDDLLVKNKDKFSYTMDKAESEQFFQSGLQLSHGVYWAYDGLNNNALRVMFVEPHSPAAQAGVIRGDYLRAINHQAIETLSAEQITLALTPHKQQTLTLLLTNNQKTKQITLEATELVTSPVPLYQVFLHGKRQEKVGYLLFNDHIATASQHLVEAINYFKQEKVSELVLDLRFNSGGLTYIANELASMIGGSTTADRVFTQYVYSKKYAIDYDYFAKNSIMQGQLLPKLNVSRIFVLTSQNTCSASEVIINSLLPFMPVIRIGDDTCGKPYGMFGENNCATAYFAVTFETKNATNQSVPSIGYTPNCRAYENLDYGLGDIQEPLLAAALFYQETGHCLFNNAIQSKKIINQTRIQPLFLPEWRRNMILTGNKP